MKKSMNSTTLIKHLSLLEGNWTLDVFSMAFRTDPSDKLTGTASFSWIAESNLLLYRAECPGSEIPTSCSIIGFDDTIGTYTMLYTDVRKVSRNYSMDLSDRRWKLERLVPGFSQRFEGEISEDGYTIAAYWERSENGSDWIRDFNIRYTKV
jgi:hypothetical protein